MSSHKLRRTLIATLAAFAVPVGSAQAAPVPDGNDNAGCIAKDATAAIAAFGGDEFGAIISWEGQTFQPFGTTIVAQYADEKEGCLFGG